jgi:hypothetical protein
MMKNKTYKAFTQNPQFACPYAIRDLIKGLDSKDIRKLLILLMHHLQPIWKGLKGITYPKTKEEIIQIVSQETSTLIREVLNLISSLPKRSYRDSAGRSNC